MRRSHIPLIHRRHPIDHQGGGAEGHRETQTGVGAEDLRGARWDGPLLLSAWCLPCNGEERAKKGPLRRAWAVVAGVWDAMLVGAEEM